MAPSCVAVCSWRRLLASRHLPLPFPCPLPLHRRRRPSASHHLVPSLSLPGLSLPPYSAFLSLGRQCQRSPGTVPGSLLCVGSTRRGATALATGQGRPSGHPIPAVGGPWGVHLDAPGQWRVQLPSLTPTHPQQPSALSPACGEHIMCPLHSPPCVRGVCIVCPLGVV